MNNKIEKDEIEESEPGPLWVKELLAEFYCATAPEPELVPETEQIPVPARLGERWRQSAITAEYLIAMQESAANNLDVLPRGALTQFIRLMAADANVSDMGPLWQWSKLTPNARLDIASARGYGELALALRLPLEETLSSVHVELAEQWGINIAQPAPVSAGYRAAQASELFDTTAGARKELFSAIEYAKQPFQLMDLQLIVSEVRAAYGVFE